MDNKISLSTLSANLSRATGKSRKICEDFIKEFFKLTTEVLTTDESLRIKGFGTFKIVQVESRTGVNVNSGEKQEILPYKKVVFTPAKEMASAINAPFAGFETVEMEDDVPEDIFLKEVINNERLSDEKGVSEYRLEEGSQEEGEDDDITLEAYSKESEETKQKEEELKPEEPPVVPKEEKEEEPEMERYEYYEEPKKSRFGIGFLVGALSTFAVCAVIFMIGCFLDWWPVNFGYFRNPEKIEIVKTEDVPAETEQVQTAEPEPVYDTVSTTRYLTTIAREHYGDYNFWPYIYIENSSILGHPDRITPGTKVIVPELSKYGVDPKNPDDVKEAKRKGAEIYERYR
ncbi:MAG: HU family DNA-binding protein [Muribaculaceae bacterium]|nr:HU family DNA-binding protein [Muribaculaceae bacterium]